MIRGKAGRVIALSRLALSSTFLLAIYVDPSQPAAAPDSTYVVLALYVLAALAILIVTWRSWWRDRVLALPTHALDLLVFAFVVLTTEGYTSPFFTFSVFLLLSASMRWHWKGTAKTGIAVNFLFLLSGSISAFLSPETLDPQRVLIRSIYLAVLSALFVSYAYRRERQDAQSRLQGQLRDGFDPRSIVELIAHEAALRTGAPGWVWAWRDQDEPGDLVQTGQGGAITQAVEMTTKLFPAMPNCPFLFDSRSGHVLSGRDQGPQRLIHADDMKRLAMQFGYPEGLAIPISAAGIEGLVVVLGNGEFGSRDIEGGEQLAEVSRRLLEQWERADVAREASANRVRLSLSRDIHDSIAQLLAGISFKLEAIRRLDSRDDKNREIEQLQAELAREQDQLRGLIAALRRPKGEGAITDFVVGLQELCGHLSTQWDIACRPMSSGSIAGSTLLEFELHQMIREGVANAVRHGRAPVVEVTLRQVEDRIQLRIADNGNGNGNGNSGGGSPQSLQERVQVLGGTLRFDSGASGTVLEIGLPAQALSMTGAM